MIAGFECGHEGESGNQSHWKSYRNSPPNRLNIVH